MLKTVFYFFTIWMFLFELSCVCAQVTLGVDMLFNETHITLVKGKRIGLITNHTAINGDKVSTIDVFKEASHNKIFTLTTLFAPEHGITGKQRACDTISDDVDADGIPIYSLHGKTHRPTPEMLKNIDVIVYDIQDIGSRSYTYVATLLMAMEAAAKKNIPVIVLDRPNPINGLCVDGPVMEEKWRSVVGYVNVPYCHGMTIGELARWFNGEYKIGCKLNVVPMKGWTRDMTFADTGLTWIPTSPYIPEASTVWYYPTTGILGELQVVSIGIGYTLPFKVVGAPWIHAMEFAKALNAKKFPGVYFHPFYYSPFYGRFAKETCEGVLIMITDTAQYQPVSTLYLILGTLKSLYPQKFKEAMQASKNRKDMFCKVNGTEEIYRILEQNSNPVIKFLQVHKKEREAFLVKRRPYLMPTYKLSKNLK